MQSKRIIFTSDAGLSLTYSSEAQTFANGGPEHLKADQKTTLSGYAQKWNVLSSDRGGYRVRLLPGSAKFSTPTYALYHHEFSQVLGTTQNGTLRIYPDETGVRVEIDLPDTSVGRDVAALVKRGDVAGMSFAMVSSPKAHETEEDGVTVLNAESYHVDEVTVTPIPAFTETSVGVKADAEPEQLSQKKKDEGMQERIQQNRKLQELRLSLYRL